MSKSPEFKGDVFVIITDILYFGETILEKLLTFSALYTKSYSECYSRYTTQWKGSDLSTDVTKIPINYARQYANL